MQKRKFDELVSYFNKKVSEMEIETKYKMELLGMVTALGCAHEKEMSDLSETKRDSSDLISRQAAIDALLHNADVYSNHFGDDPIDRYTVAIIDNDAQTIAQLPSAQQNRLERVVAGKSPEEIYDFLRWLMFDYARAYTDSRAAVIVWLEGEEDG